MDSYLKVACGSMLVLALWLPAAAQTDPPSGDEEPVRVYTNADLARFGPPSADRPVTVDDDGEAWSFVTDYLEREHERIDAERAHDLARQRAELDEEIARREARETYAYPYYGYPYFHGGRLDRHRGKRRGRAVTTTPTLGGRIIPLHARPSLAERQRAKAIRLSGVDAFPSNSRRNKKH